MTASAYVPGQILTADALNTSFDEKTDNALAAITGGSIDGIDHITVVGVIDAVSPTSGAVIVTGGVGIGMSLNIATTLTAGGVVRFLSSVASTSSATGALVVSGGVGVGGNLNANGSAAVRLGLSAATFNGTDATNATSPANGAVRTAGGMGVAKDLWVGGKINSSGGIAITGDTTLDGNLSVSSVTLAPGGYIEYGDGTQQITTPLPEAPADTQKYGRKDAAWVVLTDIPEAPTDSKKYGRLNSAWVALTDTPDAPNDAFTYGRRAAAWARVTPEAPLDAFIYGRANGAWVKTVTEAPADGKQYSRKDGAWVELSASGMWRGDTAPTDTARYPQWYNTTTSTLYVWYEDGTSAQWVICVPVPTTDDDTAGIPEAPEDGKTYGRKDATWVEVTGGGGGGVPEAPNDGNPYMRQSEAWVQAPTPAISAGVTFEDGAMDLVLPDWAPLTIDAIQGTAVTESDPTTLECQTNGVAVVQMRVLVHHNWGSSVVFGYSVDGGEIKELGRVVVESNDPVEVVAKYNVDAEIGKLVKVYISSDFEWASFSWSNFLMQIILNDSVGVPEAPRDGTPYARQDASWVPAASGGGGVPEAPEDGQQYARQDASWQVVEGGGGGSFDWLSLIRGGKNTFAASIGAGSGITSAAYYCLGLPGSMAGSGTVSLATLSGSATGLMSVPMNLMTANSATTSAIASATTSNQFLFRRSADKNGFRLILRWAPYAGLGAQTVRIAAGLTSGSPSDTAIDNMQNCFLMGFQQFDSNFYLYHKTGSGTAVKDSLTSDFPVNRPGAGSDGECYEMEIDATVNDQITTKITALKSGKTTTRVYTTDLPDPATGLRIVAYGSAGGTSAQPAIAFGGVFGETMR